MTGVRWSTKDVEIASAFDLPFSIGDVVRGRASRGPFCSCVNALGSGFERRNSGIPQQEGLKMSDWRIRHKDADGHDAQATLLCREAAIVQALFLERRQHCRVQIIEGPDGELIDRETFEREHLKRLRW
jgi:hypothetical protein